MSTNVVIGTDWMHRDITKYLNAPTKLKIKNTQLTNEECIKWYELKVKEEHLKQSPPTRGAVMVPKTQKARGIRTLRGAFPGLAPRSFLIQKEPTNQEYEACRGELGDGKRLFARPCPIQPRHGFVDSREVSTLKDFSLLWAESRAADPEAEMIIMRKYNAKASAVLTPTSMVIGPGNDGATAGKARSIHLPLLQVRFDSDMLEKAGVKNTPYLEILYERMPINSEDYSETGFKTRLVQLRDGTSAPGDCGDSIISKPVVVVRVIHADGDLLEWEKTVAEEKDVRGLVVWHPYGSPLSHYSQHALLNNLPIVFREEAPHRGERLLPNAKPVIPDISSFLEGALSGFDQRFRPANVEGAVLLMHNATALLPNPELARLVGVGTSMIMRGASAAVLGELRYLRNRNKNRSDVYKKALTTGFEGFWRGRARLRSAREHFRKPGLWSDNFGGPSWARCADLTFSLYKSMALFFRDPTDESLKEVIALCHRVINSTHNGGPLLSKFVHNPQFDALAEGEMTGVARGGFGVWEMWTEQVASSREQLKKWYAERFHPWAGPRADNVRLQVRLPLSGTYLRFQAGSPGNHLEAEVSLNHTQIMAMNECTDTSQNRFSLKEPKRDVYTKVIHQRLPSIIRARLVDAGLILKTGEVYDGAKL